MSLLLLRLLVVPQEAVEKGVAEGLVQLPMSPHRPVTVAPASSVPLPAPWHQKLGWSRRKESENWLKPMNSAGIQVLEVEARAWSKLSECTATKPLQL